MSGSVGRASVAHYKTLVTVSSGSTRLLDSPSHAEADECLSAFYGPLFVIQASFLSLSQGSAFAR